MKNMSKAVIIALAAVTVFSLAGCTNPTSPGGDKDLSGTVRISAAGDSFTTGTELTAEYSGDETVSYQWKKDGANVGTDSNKYTPDEAGSYTVTVSAEGFKSTTSAAIIKEQLASFTITFEKIIDAAPLITGPTISKSGTTTATLTVTDPEQYSSIEWHINGITGSGASFTLNAANQAYNSVGKHRLTLEVIKGGVPYNRTITFTVED